jgi:hypothetical protein
VPKLPERKVRRQQEAALTDRIRQAIDITDLCRGWRNNTGIATHVKESGIYKMRYGLGVGSPDIIGIRRTLITPEMVGRHLGVFFGNEVKRPGETREPEQEEWENVIRRFNGIYILSSTVAESVDALRRDP